MSDPADPRRTSKRTRGPSEAERRVAPDVAEDAARKKAAKAAERAARDAAERAAREAAMEAEDARRIDIEMQRDQSIPLGAAGAEPAEPAPLAAPAAPVEDSMSRPPDAEDYNYQVALDLQESEQPRTDGASTSHAAAAAAAPAAAVPHPLYAKWASPQMRELLRLRPQAQTYLDTVAEVLSDGALALEAGSKTKYKTHSARTSAAMTAMDQLMKSLGPRSEADKPGKICSRHGCKKEVCIHPAGHFVTLLATKSAGELETAVSDALDQLGAGFCYKHGSGLEHHFRSSNAGCNHPPCVVCLLKNGTKVDGGALLCAGCYIELRRRPETNEGGEGEHQVRTFLKYVLSQYGGVIAPGGVKIDVSEDKSLDLDVHYTLTLVIDGQRWTLHFCIELHGTDHRNRAEDLLDPIILANNYLVNPEDGTMLPRTAVISMATHGQEDQLRSWLMTRCWVLAIIRRALALGGLPPLQVITVNLPEVYASSRFPQTQDLRGPNVIRTFNVPTDAQYSAEVEGHWIRFAELAAGAPNMADEAAKDTWLRGATAGLGAGWQQKAATYWTTCQLTHMAAKGPMSRLRVQDGRMKSHQLVPHMLASHDRNRQNEGRLWTPRDAVAQISAKRLAEEINRFMGRGAVRQHLRDRALPAWDAMLAMPSLFDMDISRLEFRDVCHGPPP